MKLRVLYDSDGTIVAAAKMEEEGYGSGGPVPAAADGAEVGTFDVPEHAAALGPDEIVRAFRVDAEKRELVEDSRSSD